LFSYYEYNVMPLAYSYKTRTRRPTAVLETEQFGVLDRKSKENYT